ncbi:MAG: PASTA domain-containing protein [Bilophila wadsworthia]
MLGEYRSELATKKTALPVRDSGTVPDVVGQSVRRAVEMFARPGLVPVIKGNGSRVVRQTPEPGVRWAGKDSAPTSCVLWLSEQE